MNFARLKYPDIANGPGARVSLFVSGCPHHCKGCFNQETWDFNYGTEFTHEMLWVVGDIVENDYIQGLSVLGGEPLAPENLISVLNLVQSVRHRNDVLFAQAKMFPLYNALTPDNSEPRKDIWIWTGYLWEELIARTDETADILKYIDVLVDGPFIEEQKSIGLQWRGSTNQRVIDVQKSLTSGQVILIPTNDR